MTAIIDRDYKGEDIGTGNVVQFKDVAVYMKGGKTLTSKVVLYT